MKTLTDGIFKLKQLCLPHDLQSKSLEGRPENVVHLTHISLIKLTCTNLDKRVMKSLKNMIMQQQDEY